MRQLCIVKRMRKSLPLLLFVLAAGAAAWWLSGVAHDDLGLSGQAVRIDALLSAAGLGGVLVLAQYSDRFGKKP